MTKTARSKLSFNQVKQALLEYARGMPDYIRVEGREENRTVDMMFINGTIRLEIRESRTDDPYFSDNIYIARITPHDYKDGNVLCIACKSKGGGVEKIVEFIERLCREEER